MKRLSVVTALLMVFGPTTLSSLVHAGEKTIRGKGRFVSSGINQVALQDAAGTPVGQAILNHVENQGTFGHSATRSLMQWDLLNASNSNDCFEGGPGLIFPVVQFDYLTTYSDLSSTHGDLLDGELCVNIFDFSQTLFWIDANVIDGTGRFAGATGVTRIRGKTESLPPGRFSFSDGDYETTLTLP